MESFPNGLPWRTSQLIPVLRVIFPRRQWVQVRGKIYLLRTPVE